MWLRQQYGLPKNSFAAPLFKLTGLRTPLSLIVQLCSNLFFKLSDEQHAIRKAAAAVYPQGVCASLSHLFSTLESMDFYPAKLIGQAEEQYAQHRPIGSRTRAWHAVFGTGDVCL